MNEKITPFDPVGNLFLVVPNTEFTDYCIEVDKLWNYEPRIAKAIEYDLDQYAKEKKRIRLLDKEWEFRDQVNIPTIELNSEVPPAVELGLKTGRPRMSSYIVLMFMMGRGYYGGIKSCASSVFAGESRTLNILLQNKGIKMPSANCVYDNINAVSNETREFIQDAQIRMIIDEKLDNFKNLTIDSTGVEGNVCYPRDSVLICQLLKRTFHIGMNLNKFGLTNIRQRSFARIIKLIDRLSKTINMEAGKPKSAKKRRKHYRKLLKLLLEALRLFDEEMIRIDEQMKSAIVEPSVCGRVERFLKIMKDDIENMKIIYRYCYKRIFEKESTPSKEKVISTSDKDAAYIQKGNREATIGYKPQLGRSENGFVSSIIVPLGNASDSGQLENVIKDSIKRTGVIPDIISADDGYVNTAVRNKYQEQGVRIFSFSGSKGKRILSEEDWINEEYLQARNDRSSVESLMYTIKFGFDFDRVVRRGITNVRAELLEKVLAYNCCRSIEIRRRQVEEAEKLLKAA